MNKQLSENNKIIIFGGGGHGRTLIELARAMGGFDLVGVVDDGMPKGALLLGLPVLGGKDELSAIFASGVQLAVNGVGGIGNPQARWAVFEMLLALGFKFPNLIHPTAYVEPSAVLKGGVQVLSQAYVGTQAEIGFGSVINAGAILSHDVQAGKCTNFSPGALLAGNVKIGAFTQVGMGATINLKINIGENARIGNGATVKKDVPADCIVRAGTIWPVPDISRIAKTEE